MYSKLRNNLYKKKFDSYPIIIPNCPKEEFRKKLEDLSFWIYKVEDLKDGRKIIIEKPGRKSTNDFMVWIYDESNGNGWLISHLDIFNDLKLKAMEDKTMTLKVIDLLEKVYNGEEPANLQDEIETLSFAKGEAPELLLKACKWIWGQEDCNYPPPKFEGRAMSMKGIWEFKRELSLIGYRDR